MTYSEAITSSIVSIFHPATHRYDQFYGSGACLVSDHAAESADPNHQFLIIYEATSTGRGDKIFCVSLDYLSSTTTPTTTQPTSLPVKSLSNLLQSTDQETSMQISSCIKWSMTLQLSQVHLGVIPSTAISGILLFSWIPSSSSSDTSPVIGILSPFGEFFTVNSSNGEILRSNILSNDIICSSGYQKGEEETSSGPVMYFLTGHEGKLFRIEI